MKMTSASAKTKTPPQHSLIDCNIGDTTDRTKFGMGISDEYMYEGPIYIEKGETKDISWIYNILIEKNILTEEQEEIFKRFCVTNFYSKYKFDW